MIYQINQIGALLLCSLVTATCKNSSMVYILMWTIANRHPLSFLTLGQDAFIKRNCEFQNCFVTEDSNYLDDITKFDALLFNNVNLYYGADMPTNRSEEQEYILAAMEPAIYFPVPETLNGFFNMTWTYKLSSDAVIPYVIVKDKNGTIIGPKLNMPWININDMDETPNDVLDKIKGKTKAGIWVASNCHAIDRLGYVYNLNTELNKYGRSIDTFGRCGFWACPNAECFSAIQSTYYFYMSFENTFCEDYVSEKILHGLNNYAVPIVYGGADYSRFMPEGTYINAMEYNVAELAKLMNDIMNSQEKYERYFKWHSHYSFHNVGDDDYRQPVCDLCAILNNRTRREMRTYYSNIKKWWNEKGHWRGPVYQEPEVVNDEGIVGFVDKVLSFFS